MTKEEFMDLLKYYFRNAKAQERHEILADYEAHFEEGTRRGLSEEEIAKELGSPKAIYESYQSEGVIDERTRAEEWKDNAGKIAEDAVSAAGKAAGTAAGAASKTWKEVSPKIPGAMAGLTATTAKLLYAAAAIVAIVLFVGTLLVLYLLSQDFIPVPGLMPLPHLSPITMTAIGASGLFTSLSIFFIGQEGSRAITEALHGTAKKGADAE